MKKLVVFALAFGVVAWVPALAQNNDHRGDRNDNAGPAATHADTHESPPTSTKVENQYLPASGDTQWAPKAHPAMDKDQNNGGWSGNPAGHPATVTPRHGDSNWSASRFGRHPDIKGLRRNLRASRQFHGGSYSAPRDYQFRHWSYGERLPRGYFDRNYWIANVTRYDLFAPPSDLVWVRVAGDALLIDRETSEIVQVRSGVFY